MTALVLLVGIALVCTVLLTKWGKSDQGIDELRRECAALRAQIEACSTSTAELQATMQQLRGARSDLPARRILPGIGAESSDLALVRALTELSVVHSNTAIVFERLLKSTLDVKPAQTSEQIWKGRQALEASAVQEQQRCEEMKQKGNCSGLNDS